MLMRLLRGVERLAVWLAVRALANPAGRRFLALEALFHDLLGGVFRLVHVGGATGEDGTDDRQDGHRGNEETILHDE